MKGILSLTAIAVVTVTSPSARANLIFVGPEVVGGAGFGALPRALTIQSHGPSQNSESGCIAPDGGGGLIAGSGACAPLDGDIGGDEAPPIGFPKQSAPTLSSLGITAGDQVAVLFDGVQPQNSNNNVVTINDLTLKLYNGTTLVFTASGTFSNLATNPGNGKTDYLFMLDSTEAKQFDAAMAGNTNDRIALDSTISFPRQSAGPDSYVLTNINNIPGVSIESIPEPLTAFLIGSGLVALGLLRRKKPSRSF
jgi:hypothetical protein